MCAVARGVRPDDFFGARCRGVSLLVGVAANDGCDTLRRMREMSRRDADGAATFFCDDLKEVKARGVREALSVLSCESERYTCNSPQSPIAQFTLLKKSVTCS